MWKELTRAATAQFAKELFSWIDQMIERAEYLRKKEKGEGDEDKFRKIFEKEVKT